MIDRVSQMQVKEVINVRDGSRLGTVGDLEIDTETGKVMSLVLFGKGRLISFGRGGDYIVPWDSIQMIGDDTILVDANAISLGDNRKRGGIIGKIFE